MALVTCRECKKEVSETARICPHCGIKKPYIRKRTRTQSYLLIVLLFFVTYACSKETRAPISIENQDAVRIDQMHRAVKLRLKDPDSAEFKGSAVYRASGAPVVCGYVNAKNSFGGYTGWEEFIGGNGIVIMENDMKNAQEFAKSWNKLCH